MKFLCLLLLCFCTLVLKAQSPDTLRVHFLYNQSSITQQAASAIDSLLSVNKDRFIIQQIEIYGHCDFIGSDKYNDSLSLARVAAVRDFLLSKNIAAIAFTQTNGFGKRRPLNNNTTEIERLLNRRAEIIVYKTPIPKQEPKKEEPVVAQTPPPAEHTLSDLIKDTSVKVGSNLILKNINFIGGRHVLMPGSEKPLAELLWAMQENPNLQIEIQGYVCCIPSGSDGFDVDLGTSNLSLMRARYIFTYLVRMGIDPKRMRSAGFGGSNKIFPLERTEEEKAQNRRVEIKILGK